MIHCRKRAWLFVAGIVASASGSVAFGQGNTFNPYGNSGYADYREFTTPMYSNDLSLPNQARLQSGLIGTGRANQFEQFTESLDGSSADQLNSNRGVRNGIPYYQAYRLYDKTNKRVYKANETVDKDFLDRINKRDEAYQKALGEKDPAKRAMLLQKIERESLSSTAAPATPRPATAKTNTPRVSSSRITDLPPPAARRPAASTAPKAAKAAKPAAPPAAEPAAIPTPPSALDLDPSAVAIPAPR